MSDEQNTAEVTLKYIKRDLDRLVDDVNSINTKLDAGYVSKEIFEVRVGRLEKLMYGSISVILTAFLLAVAGIVFIS